MNISMDKVEGVEEFNATGDLFEDAHDLLIGELLLGEGFPLSNVRGHLHLHVDVFVLDDCVIVDVCDI